MARGKKSIVVFVLFLLTMTLAFAQEVAFSTQSDQFYFQLGQPANLVINVDNTFESDVAGQIAFTLRQEFAGLQQANTQSRPLNVGANPEPFAFDLGIPDREGKVVLSGLQYTYKDPEGIQYVTTLPDITAHFVKEGQVTQMNPQQSETESLEAQQRAAQQAAQEEAERRQQQLEQQMQQEEVQNKLENKLQNNQVSQDTSALKQQIQEQLQEQEAANKEFSQSLEQNPDIQELKEKMAEEGFEQTSQQVEAQDGQNGQFSMEFENAAGEKEQAVGKMEDGQVTDLQSTLEQKEQWNTLNENQEFQQLHQELSEDGFSPEQPQFSKNDLNKTQVELQYTNAENETATITATFSEDNTIEEVSLSKEKKRNWWLLLAAVFALSGIYVAYRFWPQEESIAIVEEPIRTFNYKKHANTLVQKAERKFSSGEKKEAFALISQAVRLFYSYKLGDGKELSVSDTLALLKKTTEAKVSMKDLSTCLNTCDMIEFAKGEPKLKEFTAVLQVSKKCLK